MNGLIDVGQAEGAFVMVTNLKYFTKYYWD